MTGIDFDFERYVARRKGAVHQRARDGSAYSYSGDRKLRRTLGTVRPVVMAIDAVSAKWRGSAKEELLAGSTRATDQQYENVAVAAKTAADRLGLKLPPVYVAPAESAIRAHALGTNDEPCVLLNADLVERLSQEELVAVLGNELGHVQNNHVIYSTALYYLNHSAMFFVRWAVKPATMTLQAWARRAEITCDRASLICTRDFDVTVSALVKLAMGPDVADNIDVREYLSQLPESRKGLGKYAELFHSNPYLPKRVQALELFAESTFYRRATSADETVDGGLSADDVDAQVAEILKVF